jgi:hypothetical protein
VDGTPDVGDQSVSGSVRRHAEDPDGLHVWMLLRHMLIHQSAGDHRLVRAERARLTHLDTSGDRAGEVGLGHWWSFGRGWRGAGTVRGGRPGR